MSSLATILNTLGLALNQGCRVELALFTWNAAEAVPLVRAKASRLTSSDIPRAQIEGFELSHTNI